MSVVTPSVVGVPAGANYYYWVVAKYGRNVVTQDQPAGDAPQSTPALITTAPAPLTGANYVRVCWNTVPNASGYDVLRTGTDRLPNGAANIGVALNTAGNCVNDQGAALSLYTLNTYNPQKNPASMRWGRLDLPKITPPPQNAPVGQCRLFVNRTTNSFDAVDEAGASCFPTPAPPPPATVCADPGAVTNLYVSTAGSDVTGTGTALLPWATLQHAIDTGVPALVCGPYYIHLAVAGTYAGFLLDNRLYLGGGPTCTDGPITYAGVEVQGDTAVTDTYIINSTATVDNGVLSLRGVSLATGNIGAIAQNHSLLNIAGVSSRNNHLGLLGAMFSIIHLEPGTYVDDDYRTYWATVQGFSASSDGIEITEDSVLTDSCPDGNNTDLGVWLECGTLAQGQFGIACIESKKAQVYMRGNVYVDATAGSGFSQGGLVARDSLFSIYRYRYFGASRVGEKGGALFNSSLSGEALGGGIFRVQDAPTGFQLTNGTVVSPPTFVNVTFPFVDISNGYTFQAQSSKVSNADVTEIVQFSATPTFNLLRGGVKRITLSNNVTSSTISNPYDGAMITFQICQDGAGAHSFAFPAAVLGEDAIGVVASKCNVQKFEYDGTATKWYAVAPMVKDQ